MVVCILVESLKTHRSCVRLWTVVEWKETKNRIGSSSNCFSPAIGLSISLFSFSFIYLTNDEGNEAGREIFSCSQLSATFYCSFGLAAAAGPYWKLKGERLFLFLFHFFLLHSSSSYWNSKLVFHSFTRSLSPSFFPSFSIYHLWSMWWFIKNGCFVAFVSPFRMNLIVIERTRSGPRDVDQF